MKRNLICIALLTIATAASAAESITFGSAAPVAGVTQWDDRGSYAMSITTSAGGRSVPTAHNVTRDKSCRVEALDNAGRIDAVSVRYNAASAPGVAGKSYRVTPQSVTYAGGGNAPQNEAAFVRADNATFSQFRAYDRIFGGRTFTVGQSFSPNKNDAEELLNVAEGTRLRSIALTLRSASDGVATFDLSMTVESNPKHKKTGSAAGGEMTLRFDGTLKMTIATARPLLLDVHGTLSGETKKPTGAHAGEANGTASIHVDCAF